MDWIAIILAVTVSLPLWALAAELLSALFARTSRVPEPVAERVSCAVLIPAHNEAGGIEAALENLTAQFRPGDRAVVVADNCTDATADLARRVGAAVLERADAERRGKGYALDHGIKYLDTDPPAVVVVLDADCVIHPGTLDRIVADAHRLQRPIQSVYLMDNRPDASAKEQVSAFALLVKNLVRPLGLHQMGMPCLLTGTGMAFPWAQFRGAEHGTGNIVEDMKLGVDLAVAGHYPRLAPSALITTESAPTQDAAAKQRTRWEHGHVQTLLSQGPRLLAAGLLRGRPRAVALAVELAIPPVTLLLMIWAFALTICTIWWQIFQGSVIPVAILGLSIVPILSILPAVWMKFGRSQVRGKTLLALPFYVFWKLPIYAKLLVSPEKNWVRTQRRAL